MKEKKKSFSENINPAMQFISAPIVEDPPIEKSKIPEGFKVNPLYIEKKSKRVQLLLQPSLLELLRKKAKSDEKSLNETAHHILREFFEKEGMK